MVEKDQQQDGECSPSMSETTTAPVDDSMNKQDTQTSFDDGVSLAATNDCCLLHYSNPFADSDGRLQARRKRCVVGSGGLGGEESGAGHVLGALLDVEVLLSGDADGVLRSGDSSLARLDDSCLHPR